MTVLLLLCQVALAEPDITDTAAPEPVVLVAEPEPVAAAAEPVVERQRHPWRAYHPVVDAFHSLTFWINEGERMAATVIEIAVFLAVAVSVPVNHLCAQLGLRFRWYPRRREPEVSAEVAALRLQNSELHKLHQACERRIKILESHLSRATQIGAEQHHLLQVLLGEQDDR